MRGCVCLLHLQAKWDHIDYGLCCGVPAVGMNRAALEIRTGGEVCVLCFGCARVWLPAEHAVLGVCAMSCLPTAVLCLSCACCYKLHHFSIFSKRLLLCVAWVGCF